MLLAAYDRITSGELAIAYGVLAGVVVAFVALAAVFGQNPIRLIEGFDGKPSASKAQFFAWSAAALGAYSAIYTAHALHGVFDPINAIPGSVLAVLGISVGTTTSAKALTAFNVATSRVAKPPGSGGLSYLLQDDSQVPDLSKMQMLAWTAIAISIFLIQVVQQIQLGASAAIPEVGQALVLLMGVGHGAYIGKKLVGG